MKKLAILLVCMVFGLHSMAQITLIPDASFEGYLVNQGIDTDGVVNGQVLTSDIADEIELNMFGLLVEDVTGIEDFANLEDLSLQVMDITSLDISQNSNLKRLTLDWLNLESLDVSNNPLLVKFFLGINPDPLLNMISILDISNNLLLEDFSIYNGEISSLNVSNNVLMESIELHHMHDLETVNLKSGSNETIDFLRIQDNTSLQCVQVDDPAAVIAGTASPYDDWIIENDPTITDDCQLSLQESIADQIVVYPNPLKEILHIETKGVGVTKLSVYDVLGRLVLEKSGPVDNIDVSKLQSGLFVLRLETDYGVLTKKLLKE